MAKSCVQVVEVVEIVIQYIITIITMALSMHANDHVGHWALS